MSTTPNPHLARARRGEAADAELVETLHFYDMPLIGAIRQGGSLHLSAASPQARFGIPEVKRSLVAAAAASRATSTRAASGPTRRWR